MCPTRRCCHTSKAECPAATTRFWLPGYLTLAAIWGASFLFIGIGVRELHPVHVTLGRVVAGALTLIVVLLLTRDRLPRDPVAWGHLFFIGLVGVVIPFTLFGYGEQRVSSGLAGIWNATTPLLTLPIAVLIMRTEKLTVRRAAGVGIGFLGVLVVLGVLVLDEHIAWYQPAGALVVLLGVAVSATRPTR